MRAPTQETRGYDPHLTVGNTRPHRRRGGGVASLVAGLALLTACSSASGQEPDQPEASGNSSHELAEQGHDPGGQASTTDEQTDTVPSPGHADAPDFIAGPEPITVNSAVAIAGAMQCEVMGGPSANLASCVVEDGQGSITAQADIFFDVPGQYTRESVLTEHPYLCGPEDTGFSYILDEQNGTFFVVETPGMGAGAWDGQEAASFVNAIGGNYYQESC